MWRRCTKLCSNLPKVDAMSLSSLFTQSLVNASKAANGSTLDEATQQLLYRSMKDLSVLQGRIDALGLFSPNETLDDISTRNLVYLSVPYVKAEIQNRIRTLDPDERIASLGLVKEQFRQFVTTLDNYGIVGEEDKDLYGRDASAVSNPTLRRELKIKQYKREKELKGKLEVCRTCIHVMFSQFSPGAPKETKAVSSGSI